jgi:hypothetical protein
MRSGLANIIGKVCNLKYLNDNNDKISKVLNNVPLASCENGISISQLVHYTQDECCWESMNPTLTIKSYGMGSLTILVV